VENKKAKQDKLITLIISSTSGGEIKEKVNLNNEILLPNEGQRYSDWLQHHCGYLDLDFSSQEEVQVPFVTIFPGILIAGEIIKYFYFKDNVLNNYYYHDMLTVPSAHYPYMKNKNPQCNICNSY